MGIYIKDLEALTVGSANYLLGAQPLPADVQEAYKVAVPLLLPLIGGRNVIVDNASTTQASNVTLTADTIEAINESGETQLQGIALENSSIDFFSQNGLVLKLTSTTTEALNSLVTIVSLTIGVAYLKVPENVSLARVGGGGIRLSFPNNYPPYHEDGAYQYYSNVDAHPDLDRAMVMKFDPSLTWEGRGFPSGGDGFMVNPYQQSSISMHTTATTSMSVNIQYRLSGNNTVLDMDTNNEINALIGPPQYQFKPSSSGFYLVTLEVREQFDIASTGGQLSLINYGDADENPLATAFMKMGSTETQASAYGVSLRHITGEEALNGVALGIIWKSLLGHTNGMYVNFNIFRIC